MVKDALGFIVALHLCPSVHEKRRVGRKRRQKMHAIPCFPLSHQPQSKDQHWIGTSCTLGAILLHTETKGSAQ